MIVHLFKDQNFVDLTIENFENVSKRKNNRIFNFCHLDINSQTQNFIKNSKCSENENVYSVYRNRSRDDHWKKKLNRTVIKHISCDLVQNNILEFIYER